MNPNPIIIMVYLCSKNFNFGVSSLIYSQLKTLLEMTIYTKLFVVCPRVNTRPSQHPGECARQSSCMWRSPCDSLMMRSSFVPSNQVVTSDPQKSIPSAVVVHYFEYTKRSSNTLLGLVYFSAERTLDKWFLEAPDVQSYLVS